MILRNVKINGGPIKYTGHLDFCETEFQHAEKIIQLNFSAHRYNGEVFAFSATFEMIAGQYYYMLDHPDNELCNSVLKQML